MMRPGASSCLTGGSRLQPLFTFTVQTMSLLSCRRTSCTGT